MIPLDTKTQDDDPGPAGHGAEAPVNIQQIPSPHDTDPLRDFPSFEHVGPVEFSFNGQAIAKTKDWECVVEPDGAVKILGMRVEILFRSLRTVRPTQPGEQRVYSLALLQSYALKSGSADPELRNASAQARAILAEIDPWLPRLRAYCATKPVPRSLAKQRSGTAAVLHILSGE